VISCIVGGGTTAQNQQRIAGSFANGLANKNPVDQPHIVAGGPRDKFIDTRKLLRRQPAMMV
jgi:hypothetical protein